LSSQEIKQPLSIDQINVRAGIWRGSFRFAIWLYQSRNETGTEERNRMDGEIYERGLMEEIAKRE
jgi:hypothetical protein